nr:MAG TPA: PORTAL PROTEIN [Caudoviricetes sp.]
MFTMMKTVTCSLEEYHGHEVYVYWNDTEHTSIDKLIHFYEIKRIDGEKDKVVQYADYYDALKVEHYVKGDNGFQRDNTRPDESHFITGKRVLNENGEEELELENGSWGIVPWIPLKYNEEEISLIRFIKSYQDEYEKLLSTTLDIINDIPESIKVIKGYMGADLEDMTANIAKYRAILLSPDGDINNLETKFEVEKVLALLKQIRKDAYEDGSGVDMQTEHTGQHTGVHLKYLYSDLDLDSEEQEQELNIFFEWLLYFIDKDILAKTNTDYSQNEVTFRYEKTLIINELEKIQMINMSRDMLPDSLLLPEHPFVDDVSKVEDELKKEKEQMEDDYTKYFNHDKDTEDDEKDKNTDKSKKVKKDKKNKEDKDTIESKKEKKINEKKQQ